MLLQITFSNNSSTLTPLSAITCRIAMTMECQKANVLFCVVHRFVVFLYSVYLQQATTDKLD